MTGWRGLLAVWLLLGGAFPAHAGLYYSAETYAPFPVKWRGYLLDHRNLRYAAVENPQGQPPSPLREEYLAARRQLEEDGKKRRLSADECADLGALHIRLGQPQNALAVLQPAARMHPQHFRLAANLGTAWQLLGDLPSAEAALEEALRLAPPELRDLEALHLKLVRLRLRERSGPPLELDDLFGIRYVGPSGQAEAGTLDPAQRQKLPAQAVALVQRLALALPADGRLLWQLGELANAYGDVRTAAAILEGCVSEFALASPELRSRRTLYRQAAEFLARHPERDTHKGLLNARADRALLRTLKDSMPPPIRPDAPNALPWELIAATTFNDAAQPTFHQHLQALDGKTVRMVGFMQPLGEDPEPGSFLLIEYPIGCWFCESPTLTGMVLVELKPTQSGTYRKGLVQVQGEFSINRTDPEGFLFVIRQARISDPD